MDNLYPFPLDFRGHRQIYCCTLGAGTPWRRLKQGLEFASGFENSVFCVATHMRALNLHMLERLEGLIERASELGAEFVTADALLDG